MFQLPREATDFFGDLLYPHVTDILRSDATKPFEENKAKLGSIVAGAVITSNGKLTPDYEYISDLRAANKGDWIYLIIYMLVFTFVTNSGKVMGDFASDRKALVLGAGYVSAPVVEYLTRDSGLGITVAAALKSEADKVQWEII